MESREVPIEVIEEMNAFLEEMEMAEAEEIVDEDEDAEEQGDEVDTGLGEEPNMIEMEEDEFDDEFDDEIDDEEDIDILF